MITDTEADDRVGIFTLEVGDYPLAVPMTEKAASDYVLSALSGGPSDDLRRAFDAMRSLKSYRRLIRHAAKAHTVPQPFRDRFHIAWTINGFRWRDAIDDDALLLRALRAILPPYKGEDLIMFRGEQARRYASGRLGLNWTPSRQVAEMFASGLCSLYKGGGILLTTNAPTAAIITGPNEHSTYLGEDEFVVDPTKLLDVAELARHPQSAAL